MAPAWIVLDARSRVPLSPSGHWPGASLVPCSPEGTWLRAAELSSLWRPRRCRESPGRPASALEVAEFLLEPASRHAEPGGITGSHTASAWRVSPPQGPVCRAWKGTRRTLPVSAGGWRVQDTEPRALRAPVPCPWAWRPHLLPEAVHITANRRPCSFGAAVSSGSADSSLGGQTPAAPGCVSGPWGSERVASGLS